MDEDWYDDEVGFDKQDWEYFSDCKFCDGSGIYDQDGDALYPQYGGKLAIDLFKQDTARLSDGYKGNRDFQMGYFVARGASVDVAKACCDYLADNGVAAEPVAQIDIDTIHNHLMIEKGMRENQGTPGIAKNRFTE